MENNISIWFSERPKWLQIAATRLYYNRKLTEEDLTEIVAFCIKEAEGKNILCESVFPNISFIGDTTTDLRLLSISDVEGINALAPKNPLTFSNKDISVIYGKNGSGKSGYVRLLKHICGARTSENILHNVFDSEQKEKKATILYEKDGNRKSIEWINRGTCQDLKSLDIFDTLFGDIFVNHEDEVSYEPPILSFFSVLISVCEKVSRLLDQEKSQYQVIKQNIPFEYTDTAEARWYNCINSDTKQESIDKYCLIKEGINHEIEALGQRLAEKDPAERAKYIRMQIQYIDSIIDDAGKFIWQLSKEKHQELIFALNKYDSQKILSDKTIKKVFEGSKLEGVGSEEWKSLWEAAREYSENIAYIDNKYPNTDNNSLCVLCHQPLSKKAKERFFSFEEFVKGDIQKKVIEAKSEYDELIEAIDIIPPRESISAKFDAGGILNEQLKIQINDFFELLRERKEQFLKSKADTEIFPALTYPQCLTDLKELKSHLSDQAKQFEKDAKKDNREELEFELKSLEAKEWLYKQKKNIEDYIKRLEKLDIIEKAKKSTNTKVLSEKKSKLAQILITDAFIDRFKSELDKLGASKIKVELVKTKVTKGQVLHKLKLQGEIQNSIEDILSEGEKRIISIAAFLADTTASDKKVPLIFDDPISSLDQSYEEAVVKRLIELSNKRQIIIFTHRLSLLGLLKHFSDKFSKNIDIQSIRITEIGAGEPAPIPISQSDIKSSLNILIDKRFPEATVASNEGKYELAETLIKSICSEFRVLIERCVEKDLLCDIVERYRPPVHTQKILELKKLTETDCILLDKLMTKYSKFEHSQSPEAPIDLPDLKVLLEDMEKLKTWREEYKKR